MSPSPAIERLRARCDEPGAVAGFWRELAVAGTPIVESLPGDDAHVLVTFVWRAEQQTSGVLVLGGWHGYHTGENLLSRLADTDVWYRTYRMRSDTRATYHFLPDDQFDDANWWPRMGAARPDPMNRRQLTVPKDERDPDDREIVFSIFSLPHAPDDAWLEESEPLPTRTLRLRERDVEVFDWSGQRPGWLLVLFDGPFFQRVLRVDHLVASMVDDGRIPPVVVAFVGHAPADRHDELHGSPSFGAFVARELMPRLQATYDVGTRPEHTIIAGSSHGGLAAGIIALEHSDVFDNVLALSGQFDWDPDWFTRRLVGHEHLHWFLSVGARETWLGSNRVLANRRLNASLKTAGHRVSYHEHANGHDYLSWRDALAHAQAVPHRWR